MLYTSRTLRNGAISGSIQKTAFATFGMKVSKNNDWFDAKSSEMNPVIDAKCAALDEFKRSPSEKSLQELRAARSKLQQTARSCASEYWQQALDINTESREDAAAGHSRWRSVLCKQRYRVSMSYMVTRVSFALRYFK